MKPDDFELDQDRKLWKPSRRSFFFGLGAALIAPMLPSVPAKSGWQTICKFKGPLTMTEAQMRYNYAMSVAVEIAALEPKAPFIGSWESAHAVTSAEFRQVLNRYIPQR